jgi:cyclase
MRKLILAFVAAGLTSAGLLALRPASSQINTVKEVAPNVYFHEGDLHGHGHCNNGWIVFQDYVLVVDANFPSGAKEIIPKIQGVTGKPIRFAFDTHHHGDHAYGNQVWADIGAIPVAHTGVIEEMKKYETGYYGNKPGRWEEAAATRPDVAASKLKPPTLLFPDQMIFDDGKNRVELRYFGVAHTHGDGFAWLPRERILFTGDACVNGPYNYVGDGDIRQWIKTLEGAQKLNPRLVCPGHGAVADGSLLEDQRQYFLALLEQARKLPRRDAAAAARQVERIREEIKKNPRIARYVGDFFPAQLEKAYVEVGGMPFPPRMSARTTRAARQAHAREHLLSLRPGAAAAPGRLARTTR